MSWDPSNLRRSNDALSDEEVILLKAKRQEVQEQLDAFATMTQSYGPIHIKPTLSLADFKRRKELRAQLATYNTLLAPHKLLPSEVLSQIFVATFTSSTLIPIQQCKSPLTLCKVCSRWRSVALATPELWTDVTLRLSGTPGLPPEGAIEATVEWFRRSDASQSSKLSLVLVNELRDPVLTDSSDSEYEYESWAAAAGARATRRDGNEGLMRKALNRVVLPFAHRFRSLQLTLPGALIAELLTVATSFPELRRISLQRGHWGWFSWQRWMVQANCKSLVALQRATAPRLTDLELVGMDSIVPTQLLDISWGTLIRLNIASESLLYPGPCYAILSQCHLLRECTLGVNLGGHNSMPPPPLVPIVHLHTLSVQFHGPSHPDATQCADFFSLLVTPALKSLVVNWPARFYRCSTFAKNPETCPFLVFLKRSNCALQSFQSDIPGSEEQVEHIALALPSLIEFRIEAQDEKCGRFGSSLQQKVKQGKALPRLKTLSTWLSDDISRFLDMVEARSQASMAPTDANPETPEGERVVNDVAISKLEYVRIEHVHRIQRRDSARIEALRGKDIDIQTSQLTERLYTYIE